MDKSELTIDELAARVGMTVRNLREWRALGLLPPARMRGRVGYYDDAEVGRIERIRELHAAGFTLDLIRRILEVAGDGGDEALRFAATLRAPFHAEDTPAVDVETLAAEWGVTGKKALRRAEAVGLIRDDGRGGYVFTSGTVARVGKALHDLGLSADDVLDATGEVRHHLDAIAALFEDVWRRHVWEPFLAAGTPETELPKVEEALRTVPSLAADAVAALFAVAMDARIEQGIRRELDTP